jgi:ParB-like chromosome segregation protein Spo0J
MLRDGQRPPPVQLLHRLGDGRWQLGDGAHRMMAARLEGKKQVEAIKLIS